MAGAQVHRGAISIAGNTRAFTEDTVASGGGDVTRDDQVLKPVVSASLGSHGPRRTCRPCYGRGRKCEDSGLGPSGERCDLSRCSSCGMEIGRAGVRGINDAERVLYRFQHGRSLAEYCAQCAMWLDSWGEFDGETAVKPERSARPARRLRISSHTPDGELQERDTVTEYWFDGRIERSHKAKIVGWLHRERYYQVSNPKDLALRWPWQNLYYGDAPQDSRESSLEESARRELRAAEFHLEREKRENERLRARFLKTRGWNCSALQEGRRKVVRAEAAVEKAHARLRSLPDEYDLLYRVGEKTAPRNGDRALFFVAGEFRPALTILDVRIPIVEPLPGAGQVIPVGLGAACPDCDSGQLDYAFGEHRVPGSIACLECRSRFVDTRRRPAPALSSVTT